jgi:NADPH:quinone reductase-like Zn-dependent oxidoreductase
MKAAVVHHPATLDSFAIEDRDEPVVGAGLVKVRWHALSLNFHDYAVVSGMMSADDGRIPISDGAGEIVAVGPGVTEWAAGDKVMSLFFPEWADGEPTTAAMAAIGGDTVDGCAAQYGLCRPQALTRIPQGYSYEEAATLPCAALTAWRALVEVGGLGAGETVLVEGSGGASVFALQFAVALGAKVIATSSSAPKSDRLLALGASKVINYHDDENWGETICELTDGGVDHVMDVGGASTLSQAIKATRVGGSVVMIGMLGGFMAELNLIDVMLRQQKISPIGVGNRAMQLRMVEAIERLGIRPVIDAVFPFSRISEAMQHQLSGQHFGKIVIDMTLEIDV